MSQCQAAQRAAGSLGSDLSSAGSTLALGMDCMACSIWVHCHTEMSINQSITMVFGTCITENNTLTSPCPVVVVCSSTLHRATCVPGPSSPCSVPLFQADAARVHVQISITTHFFLQNTRSLRHAHLSASHSQKEQQDPTISSVPHCVVPSAAAAVVVAVVAVAAWTVDTAYLA